MIWSHLPLTVSCFSKIQIGFTFQVLAHLGSPGQRAVKRVCVHACMCVCMSTLHTLCISALSRPNNELLMFLWYLGAIYSSVKAATFLPWIMFFLSFKKNAFMWYLPWRLQLSELQFSRDGWRKSFSTSREREYRALLSTDSRVYKTFEHLSVCPIDRQRRVEALLLRITDAADQLITWFSWTAWSVSAYLLDSADELERWLLVKARFVFDSTSDLCSCNLTPSFLPVSPM